MKLTFVYYHFLTIEEMTFRRAMLLPAKQSGKLSRQSSAMRRLRPPDT